MAEPVIDLVVVNGRPTIRGECDLASAARIEAWLASFDGHLLEVDLSGVTFFDSSALRTFLNVRRTKPNFRVVAASTAVVRVLELTGTRDLLLEENSEG